MSHPDPTTSNNPLDLSGAQSAPTPAIAPPSDQDLLSLTVPAPAPEMTPAQAAQSVVLAPEKMNEEQQRARAFVTALVERQASSPEFESAAAQFETLGNKEITAASEVTNRMLNRRSVDQDTASPQVRTSTTLAELRVMMNDHDPSRVDLTGARRGLRLLPRRWRNDVEVYFAKYDTAQEQFDSILRSLRSGQDELRKDNEDLQMERQRMWDLMGELKRYTVLLDAVKEAIEHEITNQRASGNSEMAAALEKDALFAVTQRRQDLMSNLGASMQGYLALGLVQTTNKELVRGVERAATTTMSVLRTAIITSQALGLQKQILSGLQGLNESTEAMMLRNAELLHQQGVEIQKQASQTAISVEALEQSFALVFQTMDEVDRFRAESIRTMDTTYERLGQTLNRADTYVQRSRLGVADDINAIGQ